MKAQLPDAGVVSSAMMATGSEPGASQAQADIHAFEQLGSTSNWLRNNRDQLSSQLSLDRAQVCVTDWQQAGVGRRGKIWQTQPGNITFSLLCRTGKPSEQLLGLSLVTGIAVAQCLKSVLGLDAKLKWPNDVMLNDRKLGGLLTEVLPVTASVQRSSASSNASECVAGDRTPGFDVITGIGINVLRDDAVKELGIGAISLREAGFEISKHERDAIVGRICRTVFDAHHRFFSEGWTVFSANWKQKDWLSGKKVLIHRQNSTEQAVARGVNEHGALMIESAGTLSPLYGGNVSVRPTA